MKRLIPLWVLFLILLCGCGADVPGAEPPHADAQFRQSAAAIAAAPNRISGYSVTLTRTIAGDDYVTNTDGTAHCSGLGTEDATIIVEESLTMGTIHAAYSEYFRNGAWCRTDDGVFRSDMTQEAFVQRLVPAVLITESLYAQVLSTTNADGSTLTFTHPTALEPWVPGYEYAQMVSAEANATLDSEGTLVQTSYQAVYICAGVTYSLQATVRVSTPSTLDLSARQEEFPTEGMLLSAFDAPKMLMQAAGDLFTARAVSCTASETLADPAIGLRTRQSSYHLHDFGQTLSATAYSSATETDLWGLTSNTTHHVTFRGGLCSGNLEHLESVTPEIMRTGCEDAILAGLFAPGYLTGANLTDTGDFYILQMTGSDSYRQAILQDLGMAEGENEQITGYLAINKYTLLPTAMGMAVESENDSRLYRLDQSLTLSGANTYHLAAGDTETEEKPESDITPLFYKVTGPEGQTLWLFGTIHVGDNRTAYLPAIIQTALASADKLVVEYDAQEFEHQVNADPALQAQLAAAYFYDDGITIRDHVSEALFDAAHNLIFAAGKHNVNSDTMKAVVWNSLLEEFLLQQGHKLCSEKSADNRLLNLAKKQGKPIESFGSGMEQVLALTSLPEPVQALLLKITVDGGLARHSDSTAALYESWCRGDAQALEEHLLGTPEGLAEVETALYRQYLDAQVTTRNAAMVSAAVNCLESGETAFFAVGTAHLFGESGILSALQAAGYAVTPVK